MSIITVKQSGGEYEVIVQPGALEKLGKMVRQVAPDRRTLLAVDANIASTHGRVAEQSLRGAGYEPARIELTAQEIRKTLATTARMYEAMLEARLERRSPVVALGGGVVGDVAGFAAATYLRGVPIVQVPTTLLAMVDASIGGKTGVNMPLPTGDLGKNLVGSFWQPRAVVADPLVLRTLSPRDFRCGLAECVKHGLIADRELLTFLSRHAGDIMALKEDALVELITRSVCIKAEIVGRDERESGDRALLNLGHTFAHAIEPIAELDLRHGEAVAVGLCAAVRCAHELGRVRGEDVKRVTELLQALGLPMKLPKPVGVARLMKAMGYDKKVADGSLRLILPTASGGAEIVKDVGPPAIEAAWIAVGARHEAA